MHQYYYYNPRGFESETQIFAFNPKKQRQMDLLAEYEARAITNTDMTFCKMSRQEAKAYVIAQRDKYRNGQQFVGATRITYALKWVAAQREAQKEQDDFLEMVFA